MAPNLDPPGEDDPLLGSMQKIRPHAPLRSDPFQTFYQAGYQAALAVARESAQSQQPVSRLLRSYPFALGGLTGAVLTTVLLWSSLSPSAPTIEPQTSQPSLAQQSQMVSPQVSSVENLPSETASAAPTAVQVDSTNYISEFITRSFGEYFHASSDTAHAAALLDRPNRTSALPTIRELSRQSSWLPQEDWGQLQVAERTDRKPSSTVTSEFSPPPRTSATVWQLRQHPDLLAL